MTENACCERVGFATEILRAIQSVELAIDMLRVIQKSVPENVEWNYLIHLLNEIGSMQGRYSSFPVIQAATKLRQQVEVYLDLIRGVSFPFQKDHPETGNACCECLRLAIDLLRAVQESMPGDVAWNRIINWLDKIDLTQDWPSSFPMIQAATPRRRQYAPLPPDNEPPPPF